MRSRIIFGEASSDPPAIAMLTHIPPEMMAEVLRKNFRMAKNEAERFKAVSNAAVLEKQFNFPPCQIYCYFTAPSETVYRTMSFSAHYLPELYGTGHLDDFISALTAVESLYPKDMRFKWSLAGEYAKFLDEKCESYKDIEAYIILPSFVYQKTRRGGDAIKAELAVLNFFPEDSPEYVSGLLESEDRPSEELLDFVNRSAIFPHRASVYVPTVQTTRFRKIDNPFVIAIVHGYSYLRGDGENGLQKVWSIADIIKYLPPGQQTAYSSDIGRIVLDQNGTMRNRAGQALDRYGNLDRAAELIRERHRRAAAAAAGKPTPRHQ